MKLIFCPECLDVIKLAKNVVRRCWCGQAYGQYLECGLNAEIGGSAIPIGFANSSFAVAINNRPVKGLGSRFDAFVIPVECETIKQLN